MSEAPAVITRTEELREPSKRRYKRTRTGCERCRTQHRKCDEGKPQCRRCTDSGATCKYVARVSFLEKNSRTLSGSTCSKPPTVSVTHEYPAVEFVINKESSIEKSASGSPSPSTVISRDEQPQDGVGVERIPEPRPISLARGPQTQDGSNHFQEKEIPNPEITDLDNFESSNYQMSSSDSSHDTIGRKNDRWPIAGRSCLSDNEIDLFKYFGHHIAPWLDVYDQGQTFGQLFTRLAMNSPCVMDGILHVSAIFRSCPVEIIKRRGVGALHLQALSNPSATANGLLDFRLMASFVLVRTRLFIQDVPESWEPTFYKGGSSFSHDKLSALDASRGRIWSSSLGLLSRLEIAYYLINQTSPNNITEPIHRLLNLAKKYIDTRAQSHEVLRTSLECLGLLTDVMNLCLPVSEGEEYVASSRAVVSPLVGAPRVTKWRELLNELRKWHADRPPELQELIETESSEAAFPVVVFAGSAGIASNILYHTAMFLLLGNKPQSMSLAELHNNSELSTIQMSPLWHARRVCGVALNSEPEHIRCWDPCVIAAFSLAARKMTHPAQRNDIAVCLSRIGEAGWHIQGLIRGLRNEWGRIV